MTPEELKRSVFPGESGGDYNALYGYSNRPGGQFAGVNVSGMTVDQALDFASPGGAYGQGVKDQIGRVATPMGAYQVVGTTLRAAKDGLGLTGNEPMTPELQDRIGMWIYQNQGPGAWSGWGGQGGGGGASVSARGGTMQAGLLGMDEEPQTFGQRLKRDFKSGDLMDRIALAANTLRMDPDPNLAAMVQGRQQQRADKATTNRTAQWLTTQGRTDLAEALMSGAIDPKSAVAMAYQKTDAVSGVEVDGRLINPQTGEVMYEAAGGTLTKDQMAGLNVLRDDLRSETGMFQVVKNGFDNVQEFFDNPGGVSDYALAVSFAKILDPGSVAREGEVAAVANAGGMIPGLATQFENILAGTGSLTDAVRNQIRSLSEQIYANKAKDAQNTLARYEEIARQSGLPPGILWTNAPIVIPPARPTGSGAGAGATQPTPLSPNALPYLPTTP